jgi:cell division protein ZapA (FtsZ GTPase activity inhibitor)
MATDNTNNETDFLNLSDEDFEKFGMYSPEQSVITEKSDVEVEDTLNDKEISEEEAPLVEENSEDNAEDADEESNPRQGEADVMGEASETADDAESEEDSENDGESEDEEKTTEKTDAELADNFYKLITKPIKANGKEFNIETPEEAMKLIQMGLNYNSKMTNLKPSRQIIKTLQQHNMLDEESIGLAVDLMNGNKDAILRLLKDKKINPLELDIEAESSYKPTNKIASEQSVDFDDVIEGIKDSTYYNDTVQTVQGWDKKSQTMVAADPKLISQLNAQMENGIYKQINGELTKRRAIGDSNLSGLSDLEAYVAVGRLLTQNGSLVVPKAQEQSSTRQTGRKIQPKQNNQANPKTIIQKKAAGVPRSKQPAKPSSGKEINPLSMSDADFDKVMTKYL